MTFTIIAMCYVYIFQIIDTVELIDSNTNIVILHKFADQTFIRDVNRRFELSAIANNSAARIDDFVRQNHLIGSKNETSHEIVWHKPDFRDNLNQIFQQFNPFEELVFDIVVDSACEDDAVFFAVL